MTNLIGGDLVSASPKGVRPELNLRILWSLARWVEDRFGFAALERISERAGIAPSDFDGTTRWISHQQFETVLAGARVFCADDDEFAKACIHRFAESYGPVRYMLWALSPGDICRTVASNAHMVTRVGRFETVEVGASIFHVRYFSDRSDSRLMCLSRQAQWAAGPTMWGLPAAHLTETSCIARGDSCCEYRLRWYERGRLLPILVGGALGLGAGAALAMVGVHAPTLATCLGALGACVGHLLELQRTNRRNVGVGLEITRALSEVSGAEAEARSQLVALHNRQRDWSRLLEEQFASRSHEVDRLMSGIAEEQAARTQNLRDVSHDLSNPMATIKVNAEMLCEMVDGEAREIASSIVEYTNRAATLQVQLMDIIAQSATVESRPERLVIADLAVELRQRLRGFAHGRDVKVSVLTSREAPKEITIDLLRFNRVVDNLLTNAAKYTERGHILLEIDGTLRPITATDGEHAQFLTLKLSDTGIGIDAERIGRIWRPRPKTQDPDSARHGVGLSSTVRLMSELGGRIDVLSTLGVGSTFWIHVPTEPPARNVEPAMQLPHEPLESIITRVVRIRRSEVA